MNKQAPFSLSQSWLCFASCQIVCCCFGLYLSIKSAGSSSLSNIDLIPHKHVNLQENGPTNIETLRSHLEVDLLVTFFNTIPRWFLNRHDSNKRNQIKNKLRIAFEVGSFTSNHKQINQTMHCNLMKSSQLVFQGPNHVLNFGGDQCFFFFLKGRRGFI